MFTFLRNLTKERQASLNFSRRTKGRAAKTGKRLDPAMLQVKKLLSSSDQRLILMVRG